MSQLNQSANEDLRAILEEILDLADSDEGYSPSLDAVSGLALTGLGILGQSEMLDGIESSEKNED